MSNLPYNVAVPVVVRLLEEAPEVERIVVLVQREVGERLAAGPGDEQYGAVSVKVAYYAEASLLGVVAPTVFMPRPKVDSVIVGMVRRAAPPVDVPGVEELFQLVRSGFGQRRKMLRRSLQPVLGATHDDGARRGRRPADVARRDPGARGVGGRGAVRGGGGVSDAPRAQNERA